jgi:hypothetical protein
MSEPSARQDPDMVLSSVRRLVDRGTPTAMSAAPGLTQLTAQLPVSVAVGQSGDKSGVQPPLPAAPERPEVTDPRPLVLTEALRVAPSAVSGAQPKLASFPPAKPAPVAEPALPPVAREAGAEPAEGAAPAPSALPHDSDALRALIAEVVRDELRGRFGEGISRNLRRMVRAEIARALAAADLE